MKIYNFALKVFYKNGFGPFPFPCRVLLKVASTDGCSRRGSNGVEEGAPRLGRGGNAVVSTDIVCSVVNVEDPVCCTSSLVLTG